VYLDFADAIKRYGRIEAGKQGIDNADDAKIIAMGNDVVKEKYGNLFDMYEKITGENPYLVPMRIYPAIHYTMGGLWVDYELMTTVPGLYCLGEANFSDHGANRLRLGINAGIGDGYFAIPYTIGNFLAEEIRTATIPLRMMHSSRQKKLLLIASTN
jgi:succinate dehydrogenase / fumarate reductase flavoprotein subunit